MESIALLPQSIPPHHLNAITSIQMDLWYNLAPYSGDTYQFHDEWEACWCIVADMQGLHELRVNIDAVVPLNSPRVPLWQILDPLRAVKGARIFEVSVIGSEEEKAMDFVDAPFVFKSVPMHAVNIRRYMTDGGSSRICSHP